MRLALQLCILAALTLLAGLPAPAAAGPEEVAAARDERVTRQAPRDVARGRSQLQRAVQLQVVGETEQALEALDTAIAHDPQNPWLYALEAQWLGFSPSGIGSFGESLRAMVQGFPNQFVLGFNLYLLILWSTVFGLTGAIGAVVFRCLPHARHRIMEGLKSRIGAPAAWFAPLVLFLPLLWGLGLISTMVLFAAWFWPLLRSMEKRAAGGLVVGGFLLWVTHAWAPSPLHPPGDEHGPFQIASAFEAAGGPGYQTHFGFTEPSGYMAWGMGIHARREGRHRDALREFTNAMDVLGESSALVNDIGGAHFALGERDRAKSLFGRAAELDPDAAEPLFNYAQVLNEELDFINADEVMQEALQLNYAKLAEFRESGAFTKKHAAIDMLPGVSPFWVAALTGSGTRGRAEFPEGLSILCPGGRIEYLPLGLVLMVCLGFLGGIWMRRSVKTYGCGSCRVIVCRRCLIRIDGRPYCQDCGQTLLADCSTQYSKALLDRYFKRKFTVHEFVGGFLAWILPGWREARAMKEGRAMLAMSLTGAALLLVSLRGLPLTVESGSVYQAPISFGWWAVLGALLYVFARVITLGKTAADELVTEVEEEPEAELEEDEYLYVVGD